MKDVLKEDATDSILTAWEEAYSVIAKLFIETEANLYAEAGWQDDQPLVVTKKKFRKAATSHRSIYKELTEKNCRPLSRVNT